MASSRYPFWVDTSKPMARLGYEHRYTFWVDDEITPLYEKELVFRGTQSKGFLFEVRTNFILRKRIEEDNEIIIDSERSERFVSTFAERDWVNLLVDIDYRLKEYWMFNDEIYTICEEALEFAQEVESSSTPTRALIPVVVGLDVITAQLEGEPLDAALDRSIRADWLIPLYLWPGSPFTFKETLGMSLPFLWFLEAIPKTRVEDVEKGLAMMDSCPICLRSPAIAAQISTLPCNHAFHYHCIVRWFLKSKSRSCPLCRRQIGTWY